MRLERLLPLNWFVMFLLRCIEFSLNLEMFRFFMGTAMSATKIKLQFSLKAQQKV
jgi:hypothetical protein